VILAFVSLSVTRADCAKMAERIDVLFLVETTPGGPRNIVLDGGPRIPPRRGEGGSMRLLLNYFDHTYLHYGQPACAPYRAYKIERRRAVLYFLNQALTFECLDLATSFYVEVHFQNFSSFKVT